MNFRTTFRYFFIPAIALVLTFKIYGWVNNLANKTAEEKIVESSGEALIGGSFSLTDQNGNIVADNDFKGKNMLVYFGFTYCPSICPTDLALITNVMQQLGDNAENIQPIFITIDPARDTPEQIKKYLSNFDSSIIGLTGTAEQIADIVNKYHIYARKVESENIGEYLMDHSSYIYLMGRDGKYITHFNSSQGAEEIVQKIGKAL
jgi:cytochrome oxidase Cu insertion factor (SCO1/SenC/PrrC family)